MIDDPLNRLKVLRGEELHNSKLTNKDIIWIREQVEKRALLYEQYLSLCNKELAKKLGVHYRTIDKVTAFYTWHHID